MAACDIVHMGQYVVIERQNYMKLHKVTEKAIVNLGKNQLEIKPIIGKPLWKTYRMEPKPQSKQLFTLVECDNAESLVDRLVADYTGGVDNRNIVNDGRSQALSTEDILELRDGGMSGQDIVGCLIENSKTFKDKPEYAQVKYLRKKEKKYFEYITIRRPTLRLVAQILYNQDPNSVSWLRTDTLSQIISASSIHGHGTYILYEGACQGLPTAAILTQLSGSGNLIRLHPGNIPPKQAIQALNFKSEQLQQLINVNITCFLRKLFQKDEGCTTEITEGTKTEKTVNDNILNNVDIDVRSNISDEIDVSQDSVISEETDCKSEDNPNRKRSMANVDEPVVYKKPRWELDTERAVEIIKSRHSDGLIVIAREDPLDIVTSLIPYVLPSRPLVVYSAMREPLMELYVHLKSKYGVVNVQLTETWTRTYQVLPDRTHPDISMPGGGGFLLTGTIVEKDS